MNKKQPLRQCTGCGEMKPKRELVRIVKSPEGVVSLDRSGKANGRGAYLKKSLEAIEIAEKKHLLDRALEVKVPAEVFEELRALVTNE